MFFERGSLCVLRFFYGCKMNSKEVTAVFIGNRDCCFINEKCIEEAIFLSIQSGIRIFLNGGMGHFDITCAKVVKRMKNRYPQIKSYLIIPYHEFKINEIDLFDEIIYPFNEQPQTYLFYKKAIPERNKVMVEWSSVAICYVYRAGGASRTLEYAQQQHLKIINCLNIYS